MVVFMNLTADRSMREEAEELQRRYWFSTLPWLTDGNGNT